MTPGELHGYIIGLSCSIDNLFLDRKNVMIPMDLYAYMYINGTC